MNMLDAIKDAGVVGAGGAGFPTWAKFTGRPDTIVVNGAECEPLLRVDQLLMEKYPEQLAQGLSAIMELTGAKTGLLALKKKYSQAVSGLERAIKEYQGIKVALLEDIYPAGDEQVLVYSVLQRKIGPGQLPLSVGVVVVNVETLLNIYWALCGQPVTHKYVTVTGAVKNPCTFKVPLGITISELLKKAGGVAAAKAALINGGPCMGSLTNPEEVVTKTTKGIVVLPEEHPVIVGRHQAFAVNLKRAMSICSQCQRCTELCPRHLLGHPIRPHMAMRMVAYNKPEAAAVQEAMLCSECGACDLYACTFGLSPRQVNRLIKAELRKAGTKLSWEGYRGEPHPDRAYRLIPIKRLIRLMGLYEYDRPAPWADGDVTVNTVTLSLKQHAGAPAQPLIKEGEQVTAGQLIAVMPEKTLGANLHASITGTVQRVDKEIVIQRGGFC